MTGSEKIVQRILEQAREQVQSMEQDAVKKAEAEKAAAVAKANEQADGILAQNKADQAERERRILAVADLELRKSTLAAKREVLDEAYRQAAQRLAKMPDDQYMKAYFAIVAEAVTKGTEGIAPANADQNRLGSGFVDMLNGWLKGQGKPAEVKLLPPRENLAGGCVVVDGNMEVDYSHSAIMRNLREDTEADVAKTLFADGREG